MKTILLFLCLLLFLGLNAQNKIPILNHNNVEVTELTVLNSKYRETNLSISPDGQYLYFFSSRGGMSWSYANYNYYKGQSQYDGDIWFSVKKKNKWLRPECLSNTINTALGEDEPNISPDGQFVIFQSWRSDWRTTDGPYYTATRSGSKWTNPQGLGGNINKFFKDNFNATDGMSVSPDGKTFLVACGTDYSGNLNIYYSNKNKDVWSYPKQLSINTEKDERSVFIAGDGKTIFFASSGYGGYGGLDIFKATLGENGKCTNITNIGKPFNTAEDDYGFIITASGEEAYFVRSGNIFYANLIDIDANLTPDPTVIITGEVTDCIKHAPIETSLALVYLDENTTIASSKTDFYTGEYSFAIPEKKGKYQIVNKESNNIEATFTINKTNSFQKIVQNFEICVGTSKQGMKSKKY